MGSLRKSIFFRVLGMAVILAMLGFGFYFYELWRAIETEDLPTEQAVLEAISTLPIEDVPVDTLPAILDGLVVPEDLLDVPPVVSSEVTDRTNTRAQFPSTTTTAPLIPAPLPGSAAPSSVNAYMLVGSDGTPSFGRADVLFILIDPPGATPVLMSVNRSLYLPSPCGGDPVRLAVLYSGCGDAGGGASVVALALGDFMGIGIDHFVAVGFSGFPRIVDALGGIEICADFPRGTGGEVIIAAGCNLTAGSPAQWWVSNRSQDELIGGSWVAVAGDGADTRGQRQSKAIFAMYNRMSALSGPSGVAALAAGLTDAFVIDSGLSISQGAQIAWSVRSRGLSTLSIPTETMVTADGKYVAVPIEPFKLTLSRVYAPAAGW